MADPSAPRGGAPGPRRPPVGRADEPDRGAPLGRGAGPRPGGGVPRADGESVLRIDPVVEPPAEVEGVLAHPAEGAAVPAHVLSDLAQAFQANADALRGMHDLQGDLAKALRRSDRAEMMLQSTNALNETFRNLATIQREILTRLEKPAQAASRLVPLMLLGLLVVLVGGVVAIVSVVERAREEQADPLAIAGEIDKGYRRGREEGTQAGEKEVARSTKALEDVEARMVALQARTEEREKEYEQVLSEKRALEAEQNTLAEEAVRLRGEGAARRAVEEEMRDTTTKLALLEPRVKQLEADLASEKAEKERLQRKFAEHRMGLDEKPAEPPTPDPVVEATKSRPVSRDARQLEAIRATVNPFLEAAGHGKDYWQVARAEGVSKDRLHEVTAIRYDAHGKILDSIEAKELVIWVDKRKQIVEFEFRQGSMVFDKEKTPFRGASLSQIVAEGDDQVRLWLGSGLLILRTR